MIKQYAEATNENTEQVIRGSIERIRNTTH
jgi:hypothetical protein